MARHRNHATGVEQRETAGAIGVLGKARLEARLSYQRRLLIASDTGDRDRRPEMFRRRLACHSA